MLPIAAVLLGYATEATAGALKRAIDASVDEVVALILPGNKRSHVRAVCPDIGIPPRDMVRELSPKPRERSCRARGRARNCGRVQLPDDELRPAMRNLAARVGRTAGTSA